MNQLTSKNFDYVTALATMRRYWSK